MASSSSSASSRQAHLLATLGAETLAKVNAARILVVGAGGIGCELLKNLVLSGFVNMEVIDLDTIDVSNLNRQFLFRQQHVGQPKATVAREVALTFNPAAQIVAHHANVKDDCYGVQFFSKFDLVINALDNVAARKHVNRLCLATDKPLIEAGTQGYLGQAQVIKPRVTECFECIPSATQKKFPICTIRSTPDKPVHCVVWAKELHKLMFGNAASSYLYEGEGSLAAAAAATSNSGAAGEGGEGEEGAEPAKAAESVYMHVVARAQSVDPSDATALHAWAVELFDAVFGAEIEKRLSMAPDTYKTAVAPPKPLFHGQVMGASSSSSSSSEASASAAAGLPDQRVLTLQQSAELFISSLKQYYTDASTRSSLGVLEFSKDSPLDLDFVTAATNLRACTFSIPMQSRFDVKSIAGNIVPAIATTNAVVAGLEVIEAIKIVKGLDIAEKCRYTQIMRAYGGTNRLLLQQRLMPPSKRCFVCGGQSATVFIDTHTTTLQDFIDKVLKGALNFNVPVIDNGESFNFVNQRLADDEEDEDEYEQKMAWLPLPMAKLVGGGLRDGVKATVTDFSQDVTLTLYIVHRAKADFDELRSPQFFEVVGQVDATATAARLDKEKQDRDAKEGSSKEGGSGSASSSSSSSSSSAPSNASQPAAAGHKRGRSDMEASSPAPPAAAAAGGSNAGAGAGAGGEDSDDEIVEIQQEEGEESSAKPPAAKKAKVDNGKEDENEDDDIVCIELD